MLWPAPTWTVCKSRVKLPQNKKRKSTVERNEKETSCCHSLSASGQTKCRRRERENEKKGRYIHRMHVGNGRLSWGTKKNRSEGIIIHRHRTQKRPNWKKEEEKIQEATSEWNSRIFFMFPSSPLHRSSSVCVVCAAFFHPDNRRGI